MTIFPDDSPLKLIKSTQQGRYLVANRNISSGEKIMSAMPFAAVPDSAFTREKPRCCLCLNSAVATIRCQGACHGRASYCSDKCMQSDSEIHALECAWLGRVFGVGGEMHKVSDYVSDYMWLLCRVLCRLSCAGVSAVERELEQVWNLCSNATQFTHERRDNEFAPVAAALLNVCISLPNIPASLCTRDAMMELVMKEECNSFGLYMFDGNALEKQSYGLALYPSAVYFNHSCVPNVVHTTIERQQVFYATQDIAAGQELNITYISLRQSCADRKAELSRVFLFDCQCARCKANDKDPTIEERVRRHLCADDKCNGVYIPSKDSSGDKSDSSLKWKCESCETVGVQ